MLEALIGGGVKLLGGLFASRSAKKARAQALQDQAQQFVRLRDAAEAAGFNPLTVLGANPQGGMVNPTPALASGEFVADALDTGIQTYFNAKQRERDIERDTLEKALMRQELANMQQQGKAFARSMSFGYEIPTANNYTGVDNATVSAFGGGRDGDPRGDFWRFDRVPLSQGAQWAVDGNLPPAQAVENEYGDIAQNVYGTAKIAWDTGANIGRILRNWHSAGSGSLSGAPATRPKPKPNTNGNFFTTRHAGPLASFK